MAAGLPDMVDPVFHLKLPPSLYETGFVAVPQEALQICGVKVKAQDVYRYWVMAATEAPAGHYAMIAGIVNDGTWSDDAKGSFLLLTAKGCTPIDPADEVFAYHKSYAADPSMPIGEQVFVNLAQDAVRRFGKAFGSKEKFVAALKAQGHYPEAPDLYVLKSAIEAQQ